MVSRTADVVESDDVVSYVYFVYKVTMSTNDTVTIAELTSSVAVTRFYGVKASDLSEVTMTAANNVLTLTSAALTNIPIVIFGAGTKAT